MRNKLGIDGGINECSTNYKGGAVGGVVVGMVDGQGEAQMAKMVGREAANLAEQLAMQEAMGGAGERIMQGLINDSRYPEDIWAKMQWVHENLTTGENIVIHYWKNLENGAMNGFKFK